MQKLSTKEWIAVAVALLLTGSVFVLNAFLLNESSVSEEVPVPGTDTPEMVVEDGDVLGESEVPLGNEESSGGTFPEGEVPEGISDEEAATM